jgi:ribosomal protein S27E
VLAQPTGGRARLTEGKECGGGGVAAKICPTNTTTVYT